MLCKPRSKATWNANKRLSLNARCYSMRAWKRGKQLSGNAFE